ncbi:RNA-binding protein involved in rRNA processing [Caldisphaera lagunensis DSM 15908]|uniref:RNA-binding protein involved in rRNA processing n=1 Tax=Caldisphaera lagunensis (strain DSM 15908 / JCM 11604 / ANMR 0165 / IC-154) TaxID=1056495 RepID=L0A7J4_CALLD|nr:RNA-binding protein [Caldisphaera lagunensis]AFZ69843.1 RNA-binding protein involved in rRNA processing [Caldisphaera lagunensis DSM 15908]
MPVPPNKRKLEILGKPKNKVLNYIIVSIDNKNTKIKLNSNVYDSKFNLVGKIFDIIGNVEKPYAVIKPLSENINLNDIYFVEIKRFGNRHYKR